MLSLQQKYIKEVIPAMKEKLGYKNSLAVPGILKVTVNIGIGRITKDEKIKEEISQALALITGQKPVVCKARKAISGFKIRKGMVVGLKITLRGKMMYDFLSRLINIALPRTRDFRGLDSKSVDKQGNLTIGIKEHIVFPEIASEEVKNIFGLEVTVVTNAEKREGALQLFKLMGFPIKSE